MMKLSTLQAVGSTVRPDGSCPVAEEILLRWGFDDGSVASVRFSSNFVFTFLQKGERRFLRFSPASEKPIQTIESEVQLLVQLASAGFHVAAPIASKFGNMVETVDTSQGTFHAVVFTALGGQQFELEDLDEPHYHAWGGALGRLHAFLKSGATRGLSRWSYLTHLSLIRELISGDKPAVLREFETVNAWVRSLPGTDEDYGLIHFDFELDNLCWADEGSVQMMDFDDCAYHWYAADIAYALRDLFEDKVDLDNVKVQVFLAGYRTQCNIADEWIERLPMFLRLRNLLGYAELLRCVDQPIETTHGWLKPLHEKFTKRLSTYRASLETCASSEYISDVSHN